MMAILWSEGTAIRPGPIPFLPAPLFLVVGLVLAIAYIVVVVSQFRTRPRIQTAQSAFVAVLLVVAARPFEQSPAGDTFDQSVLIHFEVEVLVGLASTRRVDRVSGSPPGSVEILV